MKFDTPATTNPTDQLKVIGPYQTTPRSPSSTQPCRSSSATSG